MIKPFHEEMRMSRGSALVVVVAVLAGLLVVVGVFAWGIYQQIGLGRPWGDTPLSNDQLVWLALGLTMGMALLDVPILILLVRLRQDVRINSTHLILDVPFAGRRIALRDLVTWEVRKARGTGIHYVPFRGWRVNLGAKQCVYLKTRQGGSLALGTHRPEEFIAALEAGRGGTPQHS